MYSASIHQHLLRWLLPASYTAFVALAELSQPHGICTGGMSGGPPPGSSDVFPDALALAFDVGGEQLAVSYADRSLILWDVRNLSKVS
jgi:hypothetical protein